MRKSNEKLTNDATVGKRAASHGIRMNRVLHVHTLPVWSGSGINVFLNMRDMGTAGFESELACAPGGLLIEKVRSAGMIAQPVHHFRQPVSPVRDALATLELMRIIRRGNYDVIHTHNSKAGFIGRLAAHLVGHPAIVHTFHGFFFQDRTPAWQRRVFIALERRAARWCHRSIAITRIVADWTAEIGIEFEYPTRTIYSGIELDKFLGTADRGEMRRNLGLDESRPVIGIVSKLWEGKGHADLLRAMLALEESGCHPQLLIVGEGPIESDLRQLCRDLGIDSSVTFAGFRDDIPKVLDAVDIAVLPSHFEGMGRVLLEAMARAKPVVATSVGGIPEIVVDEQTGILVPPHDPPSLAEALERLIRDKALRLEMGERGKARLSERFSSRRMVELTAEVYRDALASAAT